MLNWLHVNLNSGGTALYDVWPAVTIKGGPVSWPADGWGNDRDRNGGGKLIIL